MAKITRRKFEAYMQFAESVGDDYCNGYRKGLRGNFHGVDDASKHDAWLVLDGRRQDMGDGYRDGFAGKPPRGMHGNAGNKNAAADVDLDSHLNQRVNSREKAGWVKQAQREGMKLSEWVRKTLNDASG